MIDILTLLSRRRDGIAHTQSEIEMLVRGAVDRSIPDYQLSAWLMAAYIHPLSEQETIWLTQNMADSGERLDLTSLPKPWVDKHSTGGVGDKTSLVVLPILAACGATVVKMSGRGLGTTGGTIDKLSSIPGLRLDLTPEEMIRQAAAIRLVVNGQTAQLAPADGTFYALRDATSTVGSMPLIVSSILSKKLAAGAQTIVLDVKSGSGALLPTDEMCLELAKYLVKVGTACGVTVQAAVTDMAEPLGRCVGNALEVMEAVQVLQGREQGRFLELCIQFAGMALAACGLQPTQDAGREAARKCVASGAAMHKAREWFLAQGATVDVFEDVHALPAAPVVKEGVYAGPAGYVVSLDARFVGAQVVRLGGGRRRKEDSIDTSVGVELLAEIGQRVEPGQVILRVHAANETDAESCLEALIPEFEVGPEPVPSRPLVRSILAAKPASSAS